MIEQTIATPPIARGYIMALVSPAVVVKVSVPKEEEGVYLKPDMGVFVTFYKTGDAKKGAKETPKK